jgi:hypothetical protein
MCLYEQLESVHIKGINHIGFHIENFDDVVEICKEIWMPFGVVE